MLTIWTRISFIARYLHF